MLPSRSRENGDYEELTNCTSLGIPQFPAPPPPSQSRDALPTASPTTDHDAHDAYRRPVVTSQPPSGAAASRQVDGNRMLVDDHTQLLGRIEQSSAELDVLFTVLAEVSCRNHGDWQRLARELPICKPVKLSQRISQIEAQYRGDTKRQAMTALADWQSYRGSRATIDELTAALERCHLYSLHEEAQLLTSRRSRPTDHNDD